jgi:hypothetical protein
VVPPLIFEAMMHKSEITQGDSTFGDSIKSPNSASIKKLNIRYRELGVEAQLDFFGEETAVWVLPVRTVSNSESSFESNLQGVSLIPHFELNERSEFMISLNFAEN